MCKPGRLSVSGDRGTCTTTTTGGYGRAIVSASEEGGAPWRHVAGGPWLPTRGTRADERVREREATILPGTNRLLSVTAHQHARVPSFSLLFPDRSAGGATKLRCAPTLGRAETRDGLAAHRHTGTVINRGLSIAGGVLMEAEICDLDELTGSALGDQPPISNSSLSLSFSLGCFELSRSRGFVLTVSSFGRPLTSRDQVYNELRRRRKSRRQTKQKDEAESHDRTNIALGVPRPWRKGFAPSPVVDS